MSEQSLGAHATLLDARGLGKALGFGSVRIEVVGDIALSVAEGEFVSVVGPSGCGKTTLLMCLAGLYPIDRGELRFLGRAVTGPPPGLSVVFQDYSRSLLPWKSNLENVVFGMRRLADLSAAARRAAAREMLASVGLASFEDRYPWQVSGGMQQRVAIARALAARPRLLLLDEPLAAVDAQTRAELQDLLLDLSARYRQSSLLVTHDVDEAVYLSDRVLVLSRRPTRVVQEIATGLPRPRDQIETREMPRYLEIRHAVLERIRALKEAT
ncbi:MAG: ABC transporter ATP-binding protein [Rhodospirillales bacterium]|nr:ABC transporter ATP-binding protein [Rhodospirillales bacterium]